MSTSDYESSSSSTSDSTLSFSKSQNNEVNLIGEKLNCMYNVESKIGEGFFRCRLQVLVRHN